MRRREFIFLCGTAAAAWPSAVQAQQAGKIAHLGFLGATTASNIARRLEVFRSELRNLGYVEGQNMLIDFRWAGDNMINSLRSLLNLCVSTSMYW